ncbi:MAG: hypothetical protein H8E87_07605 [FCB group bacterium]|nr:hypothetical protein [FCB group bacterium]
MSFYRGSLQAVAVIILLLLLTSSSIAQLQRRERRKVVEFRQIEVFFDGGYYYSPLEDSKDMMDMAQSYMDSLVDGFNLYSYYMGQGIGVDTSSFRSSDDFSAAFSAGGGLRYRLNPAMGFELRFIFSQHRASSIASSQVIDYNIYTTQGPEIFDHSFKFDYVYNFHPIILNAYYNYQPPMIKNLLFTVSGGAGIYPISIDIIHNYRFKLTSYNIPINLEWRDGKAHRVIQPFGINLLAGFKLQASTAVSLGFNLEYNYLFDDEIKDYRIQSTGYIFPGLLTDPTYIPYEMEAVLESLSPKKVNLSGLRAAAVINITL